MCCGFFGLATQTALIYQDFIADQPENWKTWYETMQTMITNIYGGPDWWQGLGMALMYCAGLWVFYCHFIWRLLLQSVDKREKGRILAVRTIHTAFFY